MDGAHAAEPPSRVRTVRRFAPTVLLGVLLVAAGWWLLESGRSDTFLAALRDARWRYVGAAIIVYTASWPLRGDRFRRVLGAMGWPCRTGYLTILVFVSQAANLVVPARAGDGARAYLLSDQRNVPLSTGVAALTVERVVDLLAIGMLGVLAGGALWIVDSTVVPTVPFDRRMLLAGGVAVAGLLAVASGLVIVDRSASVRLSEFTHPWVKKLIAGCRQAIDSLARVLTAPRALGAIVGGSLLIWALDVATAVLVLGSLVSASTPLTLVLVGTVAVAAGNVAKILPLTQGGVGLYEAAFAAVIVSSTPIALEIALLAAILDHGLKNVVTGAGGLWGYATLRKTDHSVDIESSGF